MSSTPILDRQQPVFSIAPRNWTSRLAPRFVLGLIICVLLSSFSIYFIATVLVAVIVHELGHLGAGFAVNFEFRYILAGPFLISKERSGYSFHFLLRRLLSGGRVSMVPRTVEWPIWRSFILVAGGPAATLLLFLPVILLPRSPLTVALLLTNSLLAISGLIPRVHDGQPNDAKLLIELARMPSEPVSALRKLWALDRRGVEPRNWPPEVVDRLAAGDNPKAEHRMCQYIYFRECGETAQAAAALECVLAGAAQIPPDQRRVWFAEASVFQGLFARNGELARGWLEDAREVR